METNSIRPLPSNLKSETLVTSYFDKEALGVVGINICDVLEALWPGYWERELFTRLSYEATLEAILAWCKDHGAHYYARPREQFDECEAAQETVDLGLRRVVLEDLS
jgi:hypothetical protein